MSEKILIGVAWPYANGPLHLGHIAGANLPADRIYPQGRIFPFSGYSGKPEFSLYI